MMKTPESTIRTEMAVHVHPRSHHEKVCFVADVLHIWVTAPPVEGAANTALIALLAQVLGVSRRQIEIAHGATSHHKRVIVTSLAITEIRAKVAGFPH